MDQGGGGTVAQFIADLNVDVVDVGVPVLSMHAPYELVSKIDVYETIVLFMNFSVKRAKKAQCRISCCQTTGIVTDVPSEYACPALPV